MKGNGGQGISVEKSVTTSNTEINKNTRICIKYDCANLPNYYESYSAVTGYRYGTVTQCAIAKGGTGKNVSTNKISLVTMNLVEIIYC